MERKCPKCGKILVLDRYDNLTDDKITQYFKCINSQCELYLKDVLNVEK